MLAKLRKLFGSKKRQNLNINPKPPVQKRGAKQKFKDLKRSKSTFDIDEITNNDDDGFKKNNIDDFDIVLTSQVDPDHRQSIAVTLSPPSQKSSESAINFDNSNDVTPEVADLKIAQVTREDDVLLAEETSSKSSTETSESPSGSVVDMVSESTAKVKNQNEASNISFDEMEALDMLDSIVNDFDNINEKNAKSETTSLADENSTVQVEITTEKESHSEYNDDDVTKTSAFMRAKPVVSLDHVLGNVNEEIDRSDSRETNWEMSNAEPIRSSFRFVNNSSMYLPDEDTAPDLPPTDYPVTDDELDRGDDKSNTEMKQNGDICQPISPTVTSFSSRTISPNQINTHLSNGDAIKEIPNRTINDSEVKGKKKKLDEKIAVNGSVTENSEQRNEKDVVQDQENSSTSSRDQPQKRKPIRVTSFKAASRPTSSTQMQAQPVTKLVMKFEKSEL